VEIRIATLDNALTISFFNVCFFPTLVKFYSYAQKHLKEYFIMLEKRMRQLGTGEVEIIRIVV
jgi:hypothetical protein